MTLNLCDDFNLNENKKIIVKRKIEQKFAERNNN